MLDIINNLYTSTLIVMIIGVLITMVAIGYAVGFIVCSRGYSKIIKSLQDDIVNNFKKGI